MSRVLGVDLGSRRIGLAVSDPSGTLASPLRVLDRGADHASDHAAIVKVARELDVDGLVVGWPRSLSGRDGPAARAVRDEVAELEAVAGPAMVVTLHDERFSTVTATRRLRESRPTTRAKRRRTATGVDAAAAAVFLQAYLDGARAEEGR